MDTQILGWMDGLSRWRVTWGQYLRFSQLESLILRFPPRLTKIGNAKFKNTMILYTFFDPTHASLHQEIALHNQQSLDFRVTPLLRAPGSPTPLTPWISPLKRPRATT